VHRRHIHPRLAGEGLITAVSAALREATEINRRAARNTNDDLSEYLIPVNADVQEVTTIMLPDQDV
jgi:xanthine dehydrogenase YagR molybdenum-binding subunit